MTIAHIITLLGTGVIMKPPPKSERPLAKLTPTPVQYMLFTNMGMSIDISMRVAVGTSLLVILPTTASGDWRRHK